MRVLLLHVQDCPGLHVTHERMQAALRAVGADEVEVDHVLVSGVEQAQALHFRGSPTVLIDGVDPFGADAGAVGLSCRFYRTDAGLAGAPTLEQLVRALGDGSGRGAAPAHER